MLFNSHVFLRSGDNKPDGMAHRDVSEVIVVNVVHFSIHHTDFEDVVLAIYRCVGVCPRVASARGLMDVLFVKRP